MFSSGSRCICRLETGDWLTIDAYSVDITTQAEAQMEELLAALHLLSDLEDAISYIKPKYSINPI